MHSMLAFACASFVLPFQASVAPFRAPSGPSMFGGAGKPPPEVMSIIAPAYKGASRGGEAFVVGTEKEMVALWKAMVSVYGSR